MDSLLTDIKNPMPPSLLFLYDHNNFVVVVLCYWSQWSVDKMVSYFIGGIMVSILALSVLDPWDRAPVWSNQRQ
jgi:hypothetical protein